MAEEAVSFHGGQAAEENGSRKEGLQRRLQHERTPIELGNANARSKNPLGRFGSNLPIWRDWAIRTVEHIRRFCEVQEEFSELPGARVVSLFRL
jgi:hypothetical protein